MNVVNGADFACRFKKSVIVDFTPTYELTRNRFGLLFI